MTTVVTLTPTNDPQPVPTRDRRAWAADLTLDLDPASLVGSFFHMLENDEIVWQGVVVGQPQSSVYLVQIDTFAPGATNVQKLMPVTDMIDSDDREFRFYDTQQAATEAFYAWEAKRRERV